MNMVERLLEAMNAHDLDALVECFDPDYRSIFPAHPSRAFVGREQVRKNWGHIFANVPDYRSDLLRHTRDGDTLWTEWHWRGTQRDGARVEVRGIVVFEVRGERITSGRLYVEPVEEGGEDIEAAIEEMTRGRDSRAGTSGSGGEDEQRS